MLPTGHAASPPSDPLIVNALPLLSCCLQDTHHLQQAIPSLSMPFRYSHVAYRTRSISTKRSPHCHCPSVTLMLPTGHAASPPSDPLIVIALPLLSCCLQDTQHLHQAIPSLSLPFRYSHVAYRTRSISTKRSPHCHCPSVTLMLPTGHAASPPSDPLIVNALPLLSCCLQDTQHLHQAIP